MVQRDPTSSANRPGPSNAAASSSEESPRHPDGKTDVVERLQEVDWDDLLPRLLLVAKRFYRHRLRGYRNAPEPMDLVQQAIADVLDGHRTWPANVPLFNMLYGVMRSRSSNFLACQQPLGPSTEGTRNVPLQERQVGLEEKSVEWSDLNDTVLKLVEDDALLVRIVKLMIEDPRLKAADFAAMLDVPAREIYNAMKRLKRRVAPLHPSG